MSSSRSIIALVAAGCLLLALGCSAEQQDQMVASESSAQPVLGKVLTEIAANAYQMGQASRTYLDTQPEFTQSWADFPYAPGYLPGAYRGSHIPYQQQHSQYKAANGQNTIGYGYIDWSGPVNPATLYQPINLPYYYRVPPQSVFYLPNQATYQPIVKQVYQQAPIATYSKPTVLYTATKPVSVVQPVYTPSVQKF